MHGEDGLAQALKATEALRPGAETALDAVTLEAIAGDAPSCSLKASEVADVLLTDVMFKSGMLKSKGEVRVLHTCPVLCCTCVDLHWPVTEWYSCCVAAVCCSASSFWDRLTHVPAAHACIHIHACMVMMLQVKRLIKGGGVYLNNTKVTDQDRILTSADLIDGKLLLLAAGKKNKMLVRIEQQ